MPVDQVLPVAGIETCPRNSCRETIQSSCLNLGETVDGLIGFYKRWGFRCSNFSTEQARIRSLWDGTDIKWCSVQAHVAWWWRRNTFCFVFSPKFSGFPACWPPQKKPGQNFSQVTQDFSAVWSEQKNFSNILPQLAQGIAPRINKCPSSLSSPLPIACFPLCPSASPAMTKGCCSNSWGQSEQQVALQKAREHLAAGCLQPQARWSSALPCSQELPGAWPKSDVQCGWVKLGREDSNLQEEAGRSQRIVQIRSVQVISQRSNEYSGTGGARTSRTLWRCSRSFWTIHDSLPNQSSSSLTYLLQPSLSLWELSHPVLLPARHL